MARHYQFPLPYTISSIQVEFGIGQLKEDGIFQGLPSKLQNELQHAADSWSSVSVSAADLDSIPDGVWKNLAARLGLTYTVVADKPALPSHKTVIGSTSSGSGF